MEEGDSQTVWVVTVALGSFLGRSANRKLLRLCGRRVCIDTAIHA